MEGWESEKVFWAPSHIFYCPRQGHAQFSELTVSLALLLPCRQPRDCPPEVPPGGPNFLCLGVLGRLLLDHDVPSWIFGWVPRRCVPMVVGSVERELRHGSLHHLKEVVSRERGFPVLLRQGT